MAPSIDGEVHHFSEHGLYDGLFLMRDEESGTFWDHMTGEAVYGRGVGQTLPVSNLRQTTVAQILSEDRGTLVALSNRAMRTDDDMKTEGLLAGIRGRLSGFFSATIERQDERRPTMDLGLGVWGAEEAIYYPYDVILENDRAVLAQYGGRGVLVYLDPTSHSLVAWYTDADGYEWDESILRLTDGSYVESGVFRAESGERLESRRPLQVFTRWYGFSLTYPGVPIYEGR